MRAAASPARPFVDVLSLLVDTDSKACPYWHASTGFHFNVWLESIKEVSQRCVAHLPQCLVGKPTVHFSASLPDCYQPPWVIKGGSRCSGCA